jgi:hypothetical protein
MAQPLAKTPPPERRAGSPAYSPGGGSQQCSSGGSGRGPRRFAEKRSWSAASDAALVELVAAFGGPYAELSWTGIARRFSAECEERTGKQCRERFQNHLHPDVKKGGWTREEDARILELQAEMGNAWARMVPFLPGRSDNSIKNRFWSFQRSRVRDGEPLLSPRGASPRGASPYSPKNSRANSQANSRANSPAGCYTGFGAKSPMGFGAARRLSTTPVPMPHAPGEDEVVYQNLYTPGRTVNGFPPLGPPLGGPVHALSNSSSAASSPTAHQFRPILTPEPLLLGLAGDKGEPGKVDRRRNVTPPPVVSVTEITDEDIAASTIIFNWPREKGAAVR